MDLFDITPYVRPTRFGALGGVFLARALLQAAPARPTKRVRHALVAVREAAEALRSAARDRMRVTPVDMRPLDSALDRGWVGLRECLESKTRLDGLPTAARAAALLARLFPQGTKFVRADFRTQWSTSQLLLERIDEEQLTAEIVDLTDPHFLPFIRRAHAAFGDALGLGRERPESSPDPAVRDAAATALAVAIAEYGRVLAGDLDRTDPASVAAFRAAMAPLDAYRRATFGRRGGSSEEDREDGEPAPDVDLDQPLPPVEPTS